MSSSLGIFVEAYEWGKHFVTLNGCAYNVARNSPSVQLLTHHTHVTAAFLNVHKYVYITYNNA
jgi:hypothetical protein